MRNKLKIVLGLVSVAAFVLIAVLSRQLSFPWHYFDPQHPETSAAGPAVPPEETVVLRLETLSQIGSSGLVMLLGDGTIVRQDAGSPTGYSVAAMPQPVFAHMVETVRKELAKGLNYGRVPGTDAPTEKTLVRDGEHVVTLSVDWLDNEKYDNDARRALRGVLAEARRLVAENAGAAAPYLRQPTATLSYLNQQERGDAKPWPLSRPLRPAELRGEAYYFCAPLGEGDIPSGPQFVGVVEPQISTELVRANPPPIFLRIAATLPGEKSCESEEHPGVAPLDPKLDPAVWGPLGSVDEVRPADLIATLNLKLDLQAAKKADWSVFSLSHIAYRMALVGDRWYLDCYLDTANAGMRENPGNWLARSDPQTGEILRFDRVS